MLSPQQRFGSATTVTVTALLAAELLPARSTATTAPSADTSLPAPVQQRSTAMRAPQTDFNARHQPRDLRRHRRHPARRIMAWRGQGFESPQLHCISAGPRPVPDHRGGPFGCPTPTATPIRSLSRVLTRSPSPMSPVTAPARWDGWIWHRTQERCPASPDRQTGRPPLDYTKERHSQ
jgi:hypothetical protein